MEKRPSNTKSGILGILIWVSFAQSNEYIESLDVVMSAY